MCVTTSEQRRGILVAVISGGRPELADRPTVKFLPDLDGIVHGTVWSVSEDDAAHYEADGRELAPYSRAWAEEYAAAHWMQHDPPTPGGFLGAFPGREWACREAERRGCWAVLQLDDNLSRLSFIRGSSAGPQLVTAHSGLGLFLDILAGVALSTNARTVGASMTSVNPRLSEMRKFARAGFPYSLFLERVGPGREEWFGPFEDDITHSLQYGSRDDGATAAVIPRLLYMKETSSKSGMRAHYNQQRSVQLQRLFPQSANLGVRATRSNGRGEPRVFHTMPPGAVRNPLVVRDPDLFTAVTGRLRRLTDEWVQREEQANREKVARRAGQAARMRAERLRAEGQTVTPAAGSLPSQAAVASGSTDPEGTL